MMPGKILTRKQLEKKIINSHLTDFVMKMQEILAKQTDVTDDE